MNNLIAIHDLTASQVNSLIQNANRLGQTQTFPRHLQGQFIMSLFFENSTRTRVSFEMAAKNLEMKHINVELEASSLKKGETEYDTVCNLAAMGCQRFIIRHSSHTLIEELARTQPHLALINAGSGMQQHPTQALTDLMTIQSRFPDLSQVQVTIVGDILHSRVANSFIELANKMGMLPVRLVGPPNFLPSLNDALPPVTVEPDMETALRNSDVILCLRIQQERLDQTDQLNLADYIARYQLNASRYQQAKPNSMILHPGPVNIGVEISQELLRHENSYIYQQVKNGVLLRTALLAEIDPFSCG